MPVQNARKILTQSLQRLGYALLLPVSILPLAALLYRLGQPDVLDLAVLSLAGRALFSQMPLIYAVAIAFGLSRQGQGAQALAGLTFDADATYARLERLEVLGAPEG